MNKKYRTHPCPCDSKIDYKDCCGRFLSGKHIPQTAEQLMRSRYTAYTQANILYIQKTMCGKAEKSFDPVSAELWAKSVKWKKLKVITSFADTNDPSCAFVRFKAYYIAQGKPEFILETSEFLLIDNRWFYTQASAG